MRHAANAFDGMRLGAALLVLLSHCYPLTGHGPDEPLVRLSGGVTSLGAVAVQVFFAMSGYLVMLSWRRDPAVARFLARRCLRLLPGLGFVILASAGLVGPAFTTLGLAEYLSQPASWGYLAKMLVFPAQHGLPGVFADNPYPGVVNGSLWSLRLECAGYLGLAAAGAAGLLRRRAALLLPVLVCLGLGLALEATGLAARLPLAHQLGVLCLNAIPFCLGAMVANAGLDRAATFRALLAAGAVALPLGLLGAGGYGIALLLPFATLLLARGLDCDLSRAGDLSYGTYLWAFPLQQALAALLPGIGPLGLFVAALGPTLLCAALSWHLVERPALAFKPGNRPAARAPAAG